MPAATTSGADTKGNGSAKSRSHDHNQGNQDRSYTVEQKAEVIRVRRCNPTAFYDILNLEKVKTTVTDTEIKKAYRKISLLTHPDKNGHEHADEAFKMVSRAFGVLGDKDKRAKFDRFGGDPESRFGGGGGGGGASSSPFSGFSGGRTPRTSSGGAPAGGGAGIWEEEISPEEMFQRFFGGAGLGGGFGPFGGGGFGDGGFVFNMGGGPGIRVHQFGGPRPRRRPRDPNAPAEAPASLLNTLLGLLPLIVILILPLLSSLLSGSTSTPSGPSMRFDSPVPPHTQRRHTSKLKVDYFVNPAEVVDYTSSQYHKLDQKAELTYIQRLNVECEQEEAARQLLVQQAQGWFHQDAEKMQKARAMKMKACQKLTELNPAKHY